MRERPLLRLGCFTSAHVSKLYALPATVREQSAACRRREAPPPAKGASAGSVAPSSTTATTLPPCWAPPSGRLASKPESRSSPARQAWQRRSRRAGRGAPAGSATARVQLSLARSNVRSKSKAWAPVGSAPSLRQRRAVLGGGAVGAMAPASERVPAESGVQHASAAAASAAHLIDAAAASA